MDEKDAVLGRLLDELYRLKDRFRYDPVAIEALEAVQWWAEEESVPGADE